jgi:hypothetical protein
LILELLIGVDHAAQIEKKLPSRCPRTGCSRRPVPGTPEQPAAVGADPKNDRDRQGRFAEGNRLSTGNPHARHCARMLAMFRNAITDEEMYQLCRVLFEKANKGDMAALKMVWQYKVGKPLPAPNPDMIERDEWNNYQTDAMTLDEMKQVLGRLPSYVGNAIASTTLPEIAKAFTRDLGKQLLRSMPGMKKESVESREEKDEETQKNVTVPNGNLAAADGATSEPSSTRQGENVAVSNGDFKPVDGEVGKSSRSTPHASRSTPSPSTGSKSAKKKSIRKQWIEPIARKVKGRKQTLCKLRS